VLWFRVELFAKPKLLQGCTFKITWRFSRHCLNKNHCIKLETQSLAREKQNTPFEATAASSVEHEQQTYLPSVILRISRASLPMKFMDPSTGWNLGMGISLDW